MAIFLAPRANETSYKNFLSTIEDGINYNDVEDFLDTTGKIELLNTGKLYAWGNKESKKTSWAKMVKGDFVLFYKNKKFVYFGKIVHTQLSESLALALWPTKKNEKPWSCVFFLENITKINLPLSEIIKLSDGKYTMDRIQGFMPLDDKVTAMIVQKYHSVKSFLNNYVDNTIEKIIVNDKLEKKINTNGKSEECISIKKEATNFEKQIKDLLTKLEFNDVEGARDDFRINGIQVDVCGGWENALLVIECKSKQEINKGNLRAPINELRGKIELLKKGFSEHPIYKKYNHFQFIIVTKNYITRKEDIDYAIQFPRIYIWDDEFLEYYSNLYGFIKPYAKYDLLGEMNIKPLQSESIKVPAFKMMNGNSSIYNFSIDPKILLEVSFVARRNVAGERYYQRIIDEKRLNKISEYIKSGGIFPNNIVVAFRRELETKFKPIEKFNNNIEFGILEFPKDYRSCWIIDGQHRLYSFANLKDFYFNISVTAFENIEINEQRKFFLDINRNQKPVDSDLLWDLSGDVIKDKDGIISNVVKALNLEYTSPLFRSIYYPSSGVRDKKEKLKISALCVSLKKNKIADEILTQNTKNPLFSNDPVTQIKNTSSFLKIYLNTCKNIFSKNWDLKKEGFVFTNGGIAVLLGLSEKILIRASQQNEINLNQSLCEKYLKPLQNKFEKAGSSDLKKMRLSTTSEGGKSDLLSELILIIRSATEDSLFGGEIKSYQLDDEFRRLEQNLKNLIYAKCYSITNVNWFKDISDTFTFDKAYKSQLKQGKVDLNKLYLNIGLGECFGILRKNKDIFYCIFINDDNESSFSNEKILEAAITTVTEVRNQSIHYTGLKKKQYDDIIVKMNLDKLLNCINEEIGVK